jgi:hypothetical protein
MPRHNSQCWANTATQMTLRHRWDGALRSVSRLYQTQTWLCKAQGLACCRLQGMTKGKCTWLMPSHHSKGLATPTTSPSCNQYGQHFKQQKMSMSIKDLQFGMEKWSKTHGLEIDRGIYFKQRTVEDIVNLRFNPGQGVAQFKSAECGLSLLICRTHTPEEIERIHNREAAEQLTQATQVFEEALKLQRSDPRAPAGNYFELKFNITMFCALLHTLFGDKCGYYLSLMKLQNCLDTPGVYNIRHAYIPDICYRISWAIINDGRSFFSTTMIQQDFE